MDSVPSQPGVIWYNYNPVDGVLTPGPPFQVEIGSEASKHISMSQPLEVQYQNFSSLHSQAPHVILTQPQSIVASAGGTASLSESEQQKKRKQRVRLTPGERIPCEICGKTFSCSANLRDHVRLHTGERPFKCSECGMSFAQRSNWRLHKRVHTGERPYMCGVCGRTFSRSSHLPGHMRIHTGERPYKCDSCDNSFGSLQGLKNHMRTHTGEKPFTCDNCSSSFTHSSSLSSHRKRCTGLKRKRGRPLGVVTPKVKKAPAAGRRGRPRKKPKIIKKGKTKLKTSTEEKNIEIIEIDCIDKVERPSTPTLGGEKSGNTENNNGTKVDLEGSTSKVQKIENEDMNIDPKNGPTILAEDMVQVAAEASGLRDISILDQEAAVTMATLQHGAVNLAQESNTSNSI